ncbi:hypothetical protein KGI01_02840 [Kurthia gibsonii]|nr:hypothetical protein KGI01_02840 [Kurthia gibsonii]
MQASLLFVMRRKQRMVRSLKQVKMNEEKNKQKLGHKCKKHIPHEHKKNWNRAVARFQFFV